MLQDDLFDEFAHRAFVLPDFLGDAIVQVEADLAGQAFGFHGFSFLHACVVFTCKASILQWMADSYTKA